MVDKSALVEQPDTPTAAATDKPTKRVENLVCSGSGIQTDWFNRAKSCDLSVKIAPQIFFYGNVKAFRLGSCRFRPSWLAKLHNQAQIGFVEWYAPAAKSMKPIHVHLC
jgi:hypothetical protein